MTEHRVRWILAFMAVLAAAMNVLAQTPSRASRPQQGTPQQQVPETKIRTRVSLVNVPVTVVTAEGERVSNLEAKDFRITDNGVPQKIIYFDLGSVPLSLVILIETSSRIEPLLPEMRRTGILFADIVMGPEDEAGVVGFNDSVDNLADFTTDHDVIQHTINNLRADTEGSKLLDAMAFAVEMLSRLQPQPTPDLPERRRVIVIMAENTDVGSETRLGTILRRARLSNVTIYSVGIPTTLAELRAPMKDVRPRILPEGIFPQPMMPGTVQIPSTEALRNGYGNVLNLVKDAKREVIDRTLETATSGTGGQHFATLKADSIEKAVDEIGGDLHSQYLLGFEPIGANKTGYHEIKARVDRKGLKVRTRPGYYVAPPES